MMQRLADTVLGNAKESIKTFTQESFQNVVRGINGFSALVIAFLPGSGSTLDGIRSHSTFRAPRMPRWMEEGVSSFNTFLTEYDTDSESGSESEYESANEGSDHSSSPPSPSSEGSHLSRVGSSGRRHRRNKTLLQFLLLWILWPLRLWRSGNRGSNQPQGTPETRRSGSFRSLVRRLSGSREFAAPKYVGDRRRGIIEDLQLVIELFIEHIFEVVRNVVHHVLSPFKTFREFLHWAFFRDTSYHDYVDTADMIVLGDSHPDPHKQKQVLQQPLNTDNRTCQDIITSFGYPYEAYRVTTEDGYILLLERIPRRESRKAVFLQHGVLDSSLGWVSNGVVGSQAFAAFDQGYDVYLGNLRGLASREHVDIQLSPQKLCGVAHSLGGASMLIYVVTKCLAKKPHYLSRLILLSPAGFHEDAPPALKLCQYVVSPAAIFLCLFMPGIYIPTRFFRGLFNKLSRDFENYPALGGLVQAIVSYIIGGDSSNWVGAIGVSHYNMNNMPGVAVRVAVHLAQMMRTKRFIMYDYGNKELNQRAYGTPEPLDIGANYGVIDIPVDVVAGHKDKLIPSTMVKKHFDTMESAGCQASYSAFEFAHLDFTFANREELMAYVTSRLLLGAPIPGKIIHPLEETPSSRMLTGALSERKSLRERRLNGQSLNAVARNGENILEQLPEMSPAGSSPSTNSKLKPT